MKKTVFHLFLLSFFFLIPSCDDDKDHDCQIYCTSMGDCYQTINQPFSKTSCERSCFDDLEAYHSVGCDDRFLDLLRCQVDSSCTNLSNLTSNCASEIDRFSSCLEGGE